MNARTLFGYDAVSPLTSHRATAPVAVDEWFADDRFTEEELARLAEKNHGRAFGMLDAAEKSAISDAISFYLPE